MKHKQRTTQHSEKSKSEAPISLSRGNLRENLCQFPFSDGRTCRMPRSPRHKSLCLFHARAEHELLAAGEAGRRLVSLSGEFKTASDINRVLGQLFSLVAQNRIPHRDAVSLAYIAQLLLHTLPHVRNEIKTTLGSRVWDATVQQALAPPPEAKPAPAPAPAPQRLPVAAASPAPKYFVTEHEVTREPDEAEESTS
jgi:hypothetical protein